MSDESVNALADALAMTGTSVGSVGKARRILATGKVVVISRDLLVQLEDHFGYGHSSTRCDCAAKLSAALAEVTQP